MRNIPAYPLPDAVGESAQETARLDAHQDLWIIELGSLNLAPLRSSMRVALDLGCGTGIWARTLAAQFPETTFIGVDVNPPIMGDLETAQTANCRFVKANVEEDWSFVDAPGTVDFIFARMLTTAIHDWQGLFDKAFCAIKPGGYFENSETSIELLCDDIEEAKSGPLMTWFRCLAQFASRHGIETQSVDLHGQRLKCAGFDVMTERPVEWYFDASRPEMRGREDVCPLLMVQIEDILDTMTPKTFAQSLSRSLEDGQQLAADAKWDLKRNSGTHGYHTRYCIRVAQKPVQEA